MENNNNFWDEGVDYVEETVEERFYKPLDEGAAAEEELEDTEEAPIDQEEGAENEEQTEDGQEEEDDNIAFHLASILKERGVIAADTIDKNISDEDVLELYRQSHEERIQSEVQSRVAQSLEARGINDTHIQYAMAIANGFDPQFLLEQNRYSHYASLANAEEVERDTKENVIREFHVLRGLDEDEINDLMDDLELSDDKLDRNWKKATEFFGAKDQEFRRANAEMAFERERQNNEIMSRNRQVLNNALTKGEVKTQKLPPSQLDPFRAAFRDPTEVIEYNGQPQQVTKFDKFMYEFQNNLDTQLLAFYLTAFQEENKTAITQRVKEDTKDSIFNGLKTRVIKSGTPSKNISKMKSADGRTVEFSEHKKIIDF
jgi:hypothetical protein